MGNCCLYRLGAWWILKRILCLVACAVLALGGLLGPGLPPGGYAAARAEGELPPVITLSNPSDASITLIEGYTDRSIGFSVMPATATTGVEYPVGQSQTGFASIAAGQLTIAAGLPYGSYQVSIYATATYLDASGTSLDLSVAQPISVTVQEKPGITASATGTTLVLGYASGPLPGLAFTGVITGVTVTPVLTGGSVITSYLHYDPVTRAMVLNEGMVSGTYSFKLKAVNGATEGNEVTYELIMREKPPLIKPQQSDLVLQESTYADRSIPCPVTSDTNPAIDLPLDSFTINVTGLAPGVSVDPTQFITWQSNTLYIKKSLPAGVYNLAMTAHYGNSETAAKTVVITVQAIGQTYKPVFRTTTTQFFAYENYDAFALPINIEGAPEPTILFAVSPATPLIYWDNAERKVKVDAGLKKGTFSMNITATNMAGVATATYQLIVNPVGKPVIAGPANNRFTLVDGYSDNTLTGITVTGVPTPTVNMTSFDGSTNFLYTQGQSPQTVRIHSGLGVGEYEFVVTAYNDPSNLEKKTYTFIVTEGGKPPQLAWPFGDTYELYVGYAGFDLPLQLVSYTSMNVTLPKNLGGKAKWDSSREVVHIDAGLTIGTYYLSVKASNRSGDTTFDLKVVVKEAPTAPTISIQNPVALAFGYERTETPLNIGGSLEQQLAWVDSTAWLISLSPDYTKLIISPGLPTGVYTATIHVTNVAGEKEIPIRVTVASPVVTPTPKATATPTSMLPTPPPQTTPTPTPKVTPTPARGTTGTTGAAGTGAGSGSGSGMYSAAGRPMSTSPAAGSLSPTHTSAPMINAAPLRNAVTGLLRRTGDFNWVTVGDMATDGSGMMSAYYEAGSTYRVSNLGKSGAPPIYALLAMDENDDEKTLLRVSSNGMTDAFTPTTSGWYILETAAFTQDYRVTTSRVKSGGRTLTSGSAVRLLNTYGDMASVSYELRDYEVPVSILSSGRVSRLRNGGSKTLSMGGTGYSLSRIQAGSTVLDSLLIFSVEDDSVAAISHGQLVAVGPGTTYLLVDAAYGLSFRIRVRVR